MKAMSCLLIFVPLLIVGCTSPAGPAPSHAAGDDEKIKANLDKIPDPADRKLAEEQKFCAVETENRLGSMNVPQKVVIKGEPVFLCCKSCKKEAEEHPDKVLEKARELRKQNGKP